MRFARAIRAAPARRCATSSRPPPATSRRSASARARAGKAGETHPMRRLGGKVAFVTGGARGIGRAIVEKFATEGASVTFIDLDEADGARARRELADRGLHADFHRADVTVEADVRRAIEAASAAAAVDV